MSHKGLMLEMIEEPKSLQAGRRAGGRTKKADKADCAPALAAGRSGVERGPGGLRLGRVGPTGWVAVKGGRSGPQR